MSDQENDDEENYNFSDDDTLGSNKNDSDEEQNDIDDPIVFDLKFNNRADFDNFNKVMENSGSKQNRSLQKKTINKLTKYERTKILGIRAEQLASGMPPLVNIGNEIDIIKIAEMELKERKIPFIIKRPLPNKGNEYWKLEDLAYL